MTDPRNQRPQPRTRETETREEKKRETPWKPAPLLPKPNDREGFDHRYVRVSIRGQADNVNASQAFREGWEPVKLDDYPELKVIPDRGNDFPDNVVIGGLLLCKRPSHVGKKIMEHSNREVKEQMEAVDRNYFREQDARMPMLNPERRTRVSFGED